MSKEQTIQIVTKALIAQGDLNAELRPDWIEQKWPYQRAVWLEVAEAIGHTNWAWWSAAKYGRPLSTPQQGEIHVELCDIFHFGLSMGIVEDSGQPDIHTRWIARADAIVDAFHDAETSTMPLEDALEAVVVDCILLRQFNVKKFACACRAVGLSLTGLLCYYFAKVALNKFRWANGYKLEKDDPKKYVKMWKLPSRPVQEDNTYLIEVMDTVVPKLQKTSRGLDAALLSGEYEADIAEKLDALYGLNLRY